MAALPVDRRRQLRRVLGGAARRLRMLPPLPAPSTFGEGDIDRVCNTYFQHSATPGSRWEPMRHAHMRLPAWFRHGLDPFGDEYAAQQHRLWQVISGVERPYDPEIDEREHDWSMSDPIRTPGFYARRDALAVPSASDHVLATGMLLKHCALVPGDHALEYGAGFGQTALALARLGVHVDTVDISPAFCDFVQRQADFFQVPLTSFHGRFGINPRPGQKYKLIWFYESFHHCVDFQRVVQQLGESLDDGGRIVLGGEPIEPEPNAAVPYPWGVRLHSEVVAMVRRQHWFELGFTEPFLYDLFGRAGFEGWRIDCDASLFGRLHVFQRAQRAFGAPTARG